jgi:hypothetical protein
MQRHIMHIALGAIHRTPAANNNNCMVNKLISNIDTNLQRHTYAGIALLGDFNQLEDARICDYPLKSLDSHYSAEGR